MPKCLQVRTEYGIQYLVIDVADLDLVRRVSAHFGTRRISYSVRLDGAAKRVALQQAVARRRVPQPDAAHKYVGFRNGCSNDCRASNLYWQTKTEAVGRHKAAFRQDKAFELSVAEGRRRQRVAVKSNKEKQNVAF